MNCFWLLLLISFICLANARQIRYSRYNTEVIENVQVSQDSEKNINQTLDSDNEIQARVREIKYPANGNRSMRAYPLSSETLGQTEQSDVKAQVTDETLSAATTEATKDYEDETTTVSDDNAEKYVPSASAKPNAPYPAAGFKPKIPFPLPTDNLQQKVGTAELTEQSNETTTEIPIETDIKAPYPAAGYRPSKAFLLPSEQLVLENEQEKEIKPKMVISNSNHPPCGSSTNPLAPKPMEGEKEDPDSESIFLNTQIQQKRAIVLPVRYAVHPVLLTRPLIYDTPTISAW